MAIKIAEFTPPAEPDLFYADVLAGRFSLSAKKDSLSFMYEIQLFENRNAWRVCEFISECREDKDEIISAREAEINYLTLAVSRE